MPGKQAYFLTGTDTEVGKTFVACALLHAARGAGIDAIGMKPVAAGTDAEGRNEDVERLVAASSVQAGRELVNPYCFAAAVAPHIAAAEEGRTIEPAVIEAARAALAARADFLLVEGVGGFRVPLGDGLDTADLAVALGLPVILVVGLRLGCINHALLTAEAIRARGLTLAGWVANRVDPVMTRWQENVAALKDRLAAPLLGTLPFDPQADPAAAARRLTIPTI
ncbi:MAG TPA: dethiobiotin synthase [Rhodocyclaceae bacterium]|nr:dethiobiotin synthase [Rhodocyclaceae bacterium]